MCDNVKTFGVFNGSTDAWNELGDAAKHVIVRYDRQLYFVMQRVYTELPHSGRQNKNCFL